jgi:hypothetical protein
MLSSSFLMDLGLQMRFLRNVSCFFIALVFGGVLTFAWGMSDASAAECLSDLGSGQFQLQSPQPDDYTACTYLIVQPSELQPDLWNITPAQGLDIGLAMALCLAIGFAYRMIVKFLLTDLEGDKNE